MLLRLYYIYEKSSKKSREIADIVQDLREVYEFPKSGDLPIRCHGTRWIAFKRKALQRILDRYGAYIAHLTTLAQDHSLKSVDRARLTGYLRNWKKARFLIGSAMYIDAMKPVFHLSLTLQKKDADIVLSIENTLKSMKAIKSLQSKDPREWPSVELLKSRMKVVDGGKEYQGTSFTGFDAALDQCKAHVVKDLEQLCVKIKERLEWSDVQLLRALLAFIETQNWVERDDDEDDQASDNVRSAVEYIVSVFRVPLEAKGMCVATIYDELEEVMLYARKFLPIGTEAYSRIWYKLHVCPDARKWPNILLMCELSFSLPCATSRVEQIFSKLKIVKTKRRTNLNTTTLNDLLEVNVEGPSLASFKPDNAVDLWWKDCNTTRRVDQHPRKKYRPRATSDTVEEPSEGDIDEEMILPLKEWDDWFNSDSDTDDDMSM